MIQTKSTFLTNLRRRPLRTLCYLHYSTAKRYHRWRFQEDLARAENPPLLIYQMGKVGSSSLTRSLGRANLDRPIYQIHYLTQHYIDKVEQYNQRHFTYQFAPRCRMNWNSMLLRDQLHGDGFRGKLKVISMVRDPVARNISSFFENLKITHTTENGRFHFESYYGFETSATVDDTSSLEHYFMKTFDHETPLVFFEREIQGMLDVDVFSNPFPVDRGYTIIEGNKADVLVFRLEDMADFVQNGLREFLGIEGFDLLKINVGDNKRYSDIYSRFRATMRLPEQYLEQMYGSRYATHFYTEEELAAFWRRWQVAANDMTPTPKNAVCNG